MLKPDKSTGDVPIAPPMGIQPISPAGHVPFVPGVGISMPTLTGVVPIPLAGKVQAFRSTHPHGTFFGHTQNWPSDTFNHMVHSTAYTPPKQQTPPWIPTVDGYVEPFRHPEIKVESPSEPAKQFDYAPRNTYNSYNFV